MSQWAVWSPAWRFLYHVIVNCKGPIDLKSDGNNEVFHGNILPFSTLLCCFSWGRNPWASNHQTVLFVLNILHLRTFAPLLLRISSAHAIHWSRACHVIFKRAHRFEIERMTFALTWCANIFVGCSVTPTFFFGRSLPFLTLFIILKNKKNLCVGSFNYFSYAIKKGRIGTWMQVCVT